MTFDDFLEFFYARLRKYREVAVKEGHIQFGTRPVAPADFQRFLDKVAEAHVFLMGAEGVIHETLRELSQDLIQDMAESLPMPFENLLMVSQESGGGWRAEWLYRPGGPRNAGEGTEVFYFDLFREAELREDIVQPWLGLHCDFSKRDADGTYTLALLEVEWEGSTGKTPPQVHPPSSILASEVSATLGIAGHALMSCTAISHPYLYIVDTRPELTPREARLTQKNGRLPDRKRPRYIVVDRTGFEEMRRPALGGTHASPIPHERQGHWRRLSERCTRARAEGRTRTFVRDAIIGETEFKDGRATYRLVFDLKSLSEKNGVVSARR
jgi:hypothetical protein